MADQTQPGESELLGGLLESLGSDRQLGQAQNAQTRFTEAVNSGEIRMEAGVAEEAAKHCEVAVDELNARIRGMQFDRRGPMLGDNEDGIRASNTFVTSFRAYKDRVTGARTVFEQLAVSFRKAGGLVAQTEETNVRGLSGGAE